MSSRVTLNVGFYFENQHYAQLNAYIPRAEALNIPQLRLQKKENNNRQPQVIVHEPKARPPKSESKKQSEDQASEEDNNIPNDLEIDNDMDNQQNQDNEENDENEEDNLMDVQQQNQVDRALEELEEGNYDSLEESEEVEDQDEDEDMDIDSMQGQDHMKNFGNVKTKRQKGQIKDLIQLPDRRPRKDKKLDEATEIIRREEKQKKRKQYLKKQVEAQQKATLQKILNETGRKLRLREEKQLHDQMQRQHKVFSTLGNVPKIITILNEEGRTIMTHKSKLFPQFMTKAHSVKIKLDCSNCGNQSKYKMKKDNKYACSLPCYKAIQGQ